MRKLVANDKLYDTLAARPGSERLPHALLLEGPKGSGRTTFARQIAQMALCSASAPPCGVCPHCIKVEKGIHPDLLAYEGEGRNHNFSVGQVRALRSRAFVLPNEAARKVLLLRDIQDMSAQAQNALLKVLEEPPATVVFLLTCTNKSLLLETILSRVVTLTMGIPTVEACVEILREHSPQTDAEVCRQAAQEAGGNVGQALLLLESRSSGFYTAAVQFWALALAGQPFDMLPLLLPYERDRAKFTLFLASLRRVAENAARDFADPRHLRLIEIVAIIDDIAAATEGNGHVALLAHVLCARMTAVLQNP